LLAVTGGLIRRGNSDEWSHLLERYEQQGWKPKLRTIYNEISTNTLSLMDLFRAACMKMTSIIFKVSFVSELLASLCSIVAKGRSRCLFCCLSPTKNLPCEKHSDRSTAVRRQEPGALQWRSDQDWETWDKLDISGTSCWCQRRRYFVPLRTKTNNTSGSQYPTDVAHVECECSCPHLASSNQSVVYNGVFRQLRYITAIQTLPHGIAAFGPFSDMTYYNSTPVTSGLFAWTLWGGSLGDPVNLD